MLESVVDMLDFIAHSFHRADQYSYSRCDMNFIRESENLLLDTNVFSATDAAFAFCGSHNNSI